MNEIYICKCKTSDGEVVYLPKYADHFKLHVECLVMDKAREEGFQGTCEERLKELDWEIVRVSLTEITP
jgi:hypothetical protein